MPKTEYWVYVVELSKRVYSEHARFRAANPQFNGVNLSAENGSAIEIHDNSGCSSMRGAATITSGTFQVILTDGSIRAVGDYLLPLGANVLFNYGDMQWTTGSSSGGTDGFGGSPATVGLNLGDGQTCQDYGLGPTWLRAMIVSLSCQRYPRSLP